jgi:hypothetical protein
MAADNAQMMRAAQSTQKKEAARFAGSIPVGDVLLTAAGPGTSYDGWHAGQFGGSS